MADDELLRAIGELERQLARAERALPRAIERPEPAEPDPGLQDRYERLRAETRAAIAAIDSLLKDS